MAMPNREVREFLTQETFEPKDPVEHATARMEAGDAVPEAVLWGAMASRLPHRHLDRYRNASVLSWMDVYGPSAAHAMRSKYGACVDPYFPREAAE
jgi:hypothetical protein